MIVKRSLNSQDVGLEEMHCHGRAVPTPISSNLVSEQFDGGKFYWFPDRWGKDRQARFACEGSRLPNRYNRFIPPL